MLRKALLMLVAAPAGMLITFGGAGAAQAVVVTEFPSGDFRIVGEDSQLCLTYQPGVQGRYEPGPNGQAYDDYHGQSTYTTNPTVAALDCTIAVQQRWSTADNLLINSDKSDIRGRFALRYLPGFSMGSLFGFGDFGDSVGDTVEMVGEGSRNAVRWQTEDGYIFEQGRPDRVITYDLASKKLIMGDRGGANQRWRFEPAR
ncbi:hypothetical protein [Nocardia vinacea]|uniref:hypothetical protein n=1 Tax=Nocardia vinacea TaxID=96468 RepID=UPI0002FD172F|nr:hypothetical protein [Nocardia vinacea]